MRLGKELGLANLYKDNKLNLDETAILIHHLQMILRSGISMNGLERISLEGAIRKLNVAHKGRRELSGGRNRLDKLDSRVGESSDWLFTEESSNGNLTDERESGSSDLDPFSDNGLIIE